MSVVASSSSKYTRNADGHFVCPHCSKVTEKQNTMYYHMKTHTNEHKFQCLKCEEHPTFMQKSSYYHHLATAHPEDPHPDGGAQKNPYAGIQYACPCCDHTAHTKSNTLIHFARSHCKEWIPNFTKGTSCVGCNACFESSSAYLYHAVKCFEKSAPTDQISMLSRIK